MHKEIRPLPDKGCDDRSHGDYQSALGQLDEQSNTIREILLYYDEALIFSRMGERQKASTSLTCAFGLLPEGRKKEER